MKTTYIITRSGRNGETLFLVDRKKIKDRWWSTNLMDAIQFNKESAANYSANRLKYGNPEVLNWHEAVKADNDNTHIEAEIDSGVDYLCECGTR